MISELKISDYDIIRCLYEKTKNQQLFSSDDLRRFELDQKYLEGRNGIGRIFMEIVKTKLASQVGRAPSNYESTHNRKIGFYVWSAKARRAFYKGGLKMADKERKEMPILSCTAPDNLILDKDAAKFLISGGIVPSNIVFVKLDVYRTDEKGHIIQDSETHERIIDHFEKHIVSFQIYTLKDVEAT